METIFTFENLTALLTLTFLEVILGIDNLIFITITVAKLPKALQRKARMIGVFLALFFRVGLLFCLKWIAGMTEPLFEIASYPITMRGIILISGGLFLIIKASSEIKHKLTEPDKHEPFSKKNANTFMSAIAQVILIDIIFSLDSIITAIGMAQSFPIMVIAIIISMVIMLAASEKLSLIISHYPSLNILALAFLVLIGGALIVDGLGGELERNYIYFAIAFSLAVEILNIRHRKKFEKTSH